MILKYLRLRKRASKDASGNSTTPRTGTLDLVNRDDRPFVRTASNDEAGLLAEAGTPIDSIVRVDTITVASDGVVDGEKIAYGDEHFEFNASDGTTPSNAGATPVKAKGEIIITTLPTDGENLVVGGTTYVFEDTNDPSSALAAPEIWLARNLLASDPIGVADGWTEDETLTATQLLLRQADLITSAINGADSINAANLSATAESNEIAGATTGRVIVTAKYNGSTGDAVVLTTNANPNITVDGSGTLGGTTAGVDPQYLPIDITATADKSVGTLTLTGALTANDQVLLGATTYTAVGNSTTITAGTFQIGSGSAGAIINLIAAINGTDGVNTANASATAAGGIGATLVATAKIGGVAGDTIASTDPTDAASKMSWGATTLASGAATTQSEAVTAIALAMNNRAAFGAVDGAGDTVVVTHTLHGTTHNGYGFTETSDHITNAQTTAGVAGTEGLAGAQYEDDGYLYTCTSATAANDAYTWKKVGLQLNPLLGYTACAENVTAIPVTHRFVNKTIGSDAEALTLANGSPGQKLTVSATVAGGGLGTMTPTTKSGFTAVLFLGVKDTANLEYIDDTVGWILTGAYGTDQPPVIT